MDKKTQKAQVYEICIDPNCPQKHRFMSKLSDAFSHWGHKKV